jgi:type III restriction enzyme
LVRTDNAIFVVETKAQEQISHPNVQRKRRAALAWCERINDLAVDLRQSTTWHYVLLGEAIMKEWQAKGAQLAELLQYARLRNNPNATLQQMLI